MKKIRDFILNETVIVGSGMAGIALNMAHGDLQRATLVGVLTIILNGIRQRLREHYDWLSLCDGDNQ